MKPSERSTPDEIRQRGKPQKVTYRDYVGIRCHHCGTVGMWRVYYTRARPDAVFRVRRCMQCEAEIKTLEREIFSRSSTDGLSTDNSVTNPQGEIDGQ